MSAETKPTESALDGLIDIAEAEARWGAELVRGDPDAVCAESGLPNIGAARAELATLRQRVEVWTCDGCAFSFDVGHRSADGSYSCPVCSEHKLTVENAALRSKLADAELMLRAELSGSRKIAQSPTGWRLWANFSTDSQWINLEDDGTGLPLLTSAARSALQSSPRPEAP